MADYDSSLPVRTENDGDIVAQIVGATVTNVLEIDANGIAQVNLNDGTNSLVIGANGEITTIVTDGTNTIAIDASGNLSTLITDGTDQLGINADGSINVNVVSAVVGGEIHEYATTASLAPNTPTVVVTHTVTALKTFQLKSVQGAASGAFKCEVKVGATTEAVFFGSTAGGTVQVNFPQPIEVAAGVAVTLTFTNRDKQNMDVYGFINGVELP